MKTSLQNPRLFSRISHVSRFKCFVFFHALLRLFAAINPPSCRGRFFILSYRSTGLQDFLHPAWRQVILPRYNFFPGSGLEHQPGTLGNLAARPGGVSVLGHAGGVHAHLLVDA